MHRRIFDYTLGTVSTWYRVYGWLGGKEAFVFGRVLWYGLPVGRSIQFSFGYTYQMSLEQKTVYARPCILILGHVCWR